MVSTTFSLATIATPIRCAVVLFGNGCSSTSDVVHIDGAIINSYRLPKRGEMNLGSQVSL